MRTWRGKFSSCWPRACNAAWKPGTGDTARISLDQRYIDFLSAILSHYLDVPCTMALPISPHIQPGEYGAAAGSLGPGEYMHIHALVLSSWVRACSQAARVSRSFFYLCCVWWSWVSWWPSPIDCVVRCDPLVRCAARSFAGAATPLPLFKWTPPPDPPMHRFRD